MDDLPVIDILPLDGPDDADLLLLAGAIREQVLNHLAHIKSIRIRDVPGGIPAEQRKIGDNVLVSRIGAGAPDLFLRLPDDRQSVLRAQSVDVPDRHTEFYGSVNRIAGRIAGKSGVVVRDMLVQLMEADDDPRFSHEYRCIVLAFAFDTGKEADLRDRARSCLADLVAAGSTNSTIYAEYALVRFPDWSESGGDRKDPGIDRALALARQSVQLGPSNAVGREHLVSILSAMDRHDAAIGTYHRGLPLTPWKPSLDFLLGWQIVLVGDWEARMELVGMGVGMSAFAPGYMRVPRVMDLFRRGHYAASLLAAEEVIQLGDDRAYAPAIAAAGAMADAERVARPMERANAAGAMDWSDPIGAVRRSFPNPSVIAHYDRVLRGIAG